MKRISLVLFLAVLSFGCDLSDKRDSECVSLLIEKAAEGVTEKPTIPADGDTAAFAAAYYILGAYYQQKLNSSTPGRESDQLMREALLSYVESIRFCVEEYTLAGMYQTALLYKRYADRLHSSGEFTGSEEEKRAARIHYLNALSAYSDKSLEKCLTLLRYINSEITVCTTTRDLFETTGAEIISFRGGIVEEIAQIYRSYPLDSALLEEEVEVYRDFLSEKYLEIIESALEKYRDGRAELEKYSVRQNRWRDTLDARITRIENELEREPAE